VPALTATGFITLARILVSFLVVSGLIGFLGANDLDKAMLHDP